MNESPFSSTVAFSVGPVTVTSAVAITWAIMLILTLVSFLVTRRLKIQPDKFQSALELLITVIDTQITDTMRAAPERFRGLIGTIFLFVLIANWSSLVPGVTPPTATLETDAALALVVLAATIGYGVSARGLMGYLKTFASPTWIMIPINLFAQITRTFSMIIRLFGNVMSGVFIVAIVLSVAGLLVPIPLMALDLLTGTVQAYIFAVLSMVFIGAAIEQDDGNSKGRQRLTDRKNVHELH